MPIRNSLIVALASLALVAPVRAQSAPVLVISQPSAEQPPTDGGKSWRAPKCERVAGTDAVTFTLDEGATLAGTTRRLGSSGYTFGLAALPAGNTLAAVFNRTYYRSTSAGCRWTEIGEIPTVSDGFPVTLVASAGDRAYGYSDGRPDLARLEGRNIASLRAPVDAIVGMGADSADGNRARLGGGDGSIWETTDGGEGRWTFLGAAPLPSNPIVYRAAFDPADLDHAIVTVATDGAYVTFDGGASWTRSTGLSSTGDGPVNVFNAVVAPAGGHVVWAMGLDLDEADAGAPSGGRHIYRSTDGGLTFTPVVDQSEDVRLQNGPTMAAPPNSTDVVYFTFGMSFQNYGTDVFRYDEATGQVTKTHNAFDRVPAIAFNPGDPSVMYLGLAYEGGF